MYQQLLRNHTISMQIGKLQGLSMQEENLSQITRWAQNVQSPPVYSPPSQSEQMRSGQVYQPVYSPNPPPQFTPPTGSRNTKLGFILAGLCILAGGLILIFVYFSATGLPGGSSSNSAPTTSTPNVSTSTSTTAPTATSIPTRTATTLPGQKYIDNAKMSAAVDQNTLQPSQLTTTFKTGQQYLRLFPGAS